MGNSSPTRARESFDHKNFYPSSYPYKNQQYYPNAKYSQNYRQAENITRNQNGYKMDPYNRYVNRGNPNAFLPNKENFPMQDPMNRDFRLNVVNLDKKYGQDPNLLVLDLNNNFNNKQGSKPSLFGPQNTPYQGQDMMKPNENQQPSESNTKSLIKNTTTPYKNQFNQEDNFQQNQMNYPNMPQIDYGAGNAPPYLPDEMAKRNQINFKFNQIYEKDNQLNSNNELRPPLNQPEQNLSNYAQNPDYYREDYKKNIKKNQGVNSQTSIEKHIRNFSRDESFFQKKNDVKNTTIDYLLYKKERDNKLQVEDLMDKNKNEVNKDYNNVFLNNDGLQYNKKETAEFPTAFPKMKSRNFNYKNEGFDKLEEISNLFMKKKFMSISNDAKTCEDFSNFFIFPGTAEYNNLDINPLFYVIYNNDFKSKYCCYSSCRNVEAKILHARGLYKGHEFLEILENEVGCCGSDQISIYYTEEGHKIKIGKIELNTSFFGESILILNDKDQILYKISQSTSEGCKMVCKCNFEAFQEIKFEILSNISNEKLANIKKKRNTCCFLSDANEHDEFHLEFPQTTTKIEKALIFATFIYLQKKFFEG